MISLTHSFCQVPLSVAFNGKKTDTDYNDFNAAASSNVRGDLDWENR